MTGLRSPWARRLGHRVTAPFRDRRTWAGAAVLLAGAVPAVVTLAVVLATLVLGGLLAPVGVGVVLLLGALLLGRAAAEADRRVLAAALDLADQLDRDAVTPGRRAGWAERGRALVADPRTWRSLAWLAVRAGAGLLVLLGLLVAGVVAVALVAVPFLDGYLAFGPTWRSTAGWASAWTLPVAALLLVGVVHGLHALVTAHVRLAVLLLGPDPAERLAALQQAVERSDERARVARELHDGLGHALTLVVVQAEAGATALPHDPQAAGRHLQAVTSAARQALDDLDHALGLLHGTPAARREYTLDDLPALVRSAREAGIDLHHSGWQAPVPALPAAVGTAAYRVVQEAFTNALRHSGSGPAELDVRDAPDGFTVTVSTPAGRRSMLPLPGPRAGGRGLAGLDRRVRETGGTFRAGARGDRFVVEARWPRG